MTSSLHLQVCRLSVSENRKLDKRYVFRIIQVGFGFVERATKIA